MIKIIGIDIGGTKCSITLGQKIDTCELSILDKISFSTEAEKGVKYSLKRIFETIEIILKRNCLKIKQVKSIGISCGGSLDSKKGIILNVPNLIGWENTPIVELIENKYGIKTYIENDANACVLAEWKLGAGKGFHNIIFLTFGTGMGAGFIFDDRIYRGSTDMAGEVGHIRLSENGPVGFGKAGSFEGFCSGGGIAQIAKQKVLEKFQIGEKVSFCKELGNISELNAKMINDAAKSGDELAIEIFNISGQYLGRGISILIDILNPELIIIGSIFNRSRDLLWPSAKKVIEIESLKFSKNKCKIVPAGLGEKIGDYAALTVAINGCK